MVILTEDNSSENCNKMSDVSRSFLVDSLILKKPKADHLPVSPTNKTPEDASSLRALGGFGSLPQQLAANHQAFHCFPRPPGTGGGLLDLYCPWCPSGTTIRAPGIPNLGMVPLPATGPSTSVSVAASAATAAAAISAAATLQQNMNQQQHQQQLYNNRVMKPVVNRATASSMLQPYIIPQRATLGSLPGSTSAFRPRSLDTSMRSTGINVIEPRRLPYLGIGKYVFVLFVAYKRM